MQLSTPVFHEVPQGSPEWHALRARHFNASEAPIPMGLSSYSRRGELLRLKATGGESEIWGPAADKGHASEAEARPMAEAIVHEELYPATVTREVDGLPLLASCDGLTMDGSTGFEHKLWNSALAAEVDSGVVPEQYRPQLEQQMIVTGATRILFMMSDGTPDLCAWCWYESDPAMLQKLIAAWRQFRSDLSEYQHVEEAPEPVAAVPDSLPALMLDITGAVTASNMGDFQAVVSRRIQAINTDLQSDQDFADAAEMVKFLGDGEKQLEDAKARALSQTAEIDQLFQAVDRLKADMRSKRLELNSLVEARKQTIRSDIIEAAKTAVSAYGLHVGEGLDDRLPAPPYDAAAVHGTVAAAMKGRRTITTLRDAADQVVADQKIALDEWAARASANLEAYDKLGRDVGYLFPDLGKLAASKEFDDFIATVKSRMSEALEAERKRDEEKREQIRREEEGRARAAAQAEHQPPADEEERVERPTAHPHRVSGTEDTAPGSGDCAPSDANEAPTVTLKEISSRLGFAVRADFLSSLGFPGTRNKSAVLFRESEFIAICDALIEHIGKAKHAIRAAA